MNQERWNDKVKRLMLEQGITQEKMGEIIGMSQGNVSNKLNGTRHTRPEEMAAFARAVKTTVGDLYGEKREANLSEMEIALIHGFRTLPPDQQQAQATLFASIAKINAANGQN